MRRSLQLTMTLAATVGLAAGCGDDASTAAATTTTVDVSHIHGLALDPSDPSSVLIATHSGLASYSDGSLSKVGDYSTDLMGFSVGPDGQYFASGHPGFDDDSPMALGLIVSSDGGQEWDPVSLAGEADFHALDAWSGGVVGFDGAVGALRISTDDGATWTQGASDVAAFDLAADGTTIAATTEGGLRISDDGGQSFAAPPAPLLQLVDFTDDGLLVGLDPSGKVHVSDDLADWETRGAVTFGQVQAFTAGAGDELWVATTEGLQHSTDGGASFSTAAAW